MRGSITHTSPQYQVLTSELLDALVTWITTYFSGREGVRVLEVGAGDGRLSHYLREALQERNHDQVVVVATDASGLGGLAQVQTADFRDALHEHMPDMVLCSWMPLGDDWTAAFRACKSVMSYLLIGEVDDGCCGHPWKTWGYLAPSAIDCDVCSISSTSSESSDSEATSQSASSIPTRECLDAGRSHADDWRFVYRHSPSRTPFGIDGWTRRELIEPSKTALCRTDTPWSTTRHSHVVLFERTSGCSTEFCR